MCVCVNIEWVSILGDFESQVRMHEWVCAFMLMAFVILRDMYESLNPNCIQPDFPSIFLFSHIRISHIQISHKCFVSSRMSSNLKFRFLTFRYLTFRFPIQISHIQISHIQISHKLFCFEQDVLEPLVCVVCWSLVYGIDCDYAHKQDSTGT